MSNLTEIITEELNREEETVVEAPKTKKKPRTEKQIAALAKGRATKARNKELKEIEERQKNQMLEKIHQKVESFDMSTLMNKISGLYHEVKEKKQNRNQHQKLFLSK